MLRVAFAISLAGCISSGTVTCPDGTLCPEGSACLEVTLGTLPPSTEIRCVLDDNVAACNGLDDNASCVLVGDSTPGTCHDRACFPSGCGNGLPDVGEVCDDGNTEFGDGCSGGCHSDETCGNKIIDPVMQGVDQSGNPILNPREACDVGDVTPHDGCGTNCEIEQPRWRPHPIGIPSARKGATMAYDARHGNFVLFGGIDSKLVNDTWISSIVPCTDLSGECLTWNLLSPTSQPPARSGHAMVYDSKRGQVVLFGGNARTGQNIELGDTWIWDGLTWRQSPVQGPSPRSRTAMAYDSRRDRIVLFGGATNLGDTWEWDGSVWEQKTPQRTPTPQADHAMAYDPVSGHVVLVDVQSPARTWSWDGDNWTLMMGGFTPTKRTNAGMTFDPVTQRLLLFGGDDGNASASAKAETYELDGNDWKIVDAMPISRHELAIATDVDHGRVMIFGGANGPNSLLQITSVWNGTAWRDQSLNNQPPPIVFRPAVYDAIRDRIVTFGTDSRETWELAGTTWLRVAVGGPAAKTEFAMTYDERQGTSLLFGGTSGVAVDETWSWDGVAWRNRLPSKKPSPRLFPAMAYDVARDRVVLFGGTGGTDALQDTWLWEDATSSWTPVTTGTTPPGRLHHVLGYDHVRHQIVMFGGVNGVDLDDTWVFDGTDWHAVTGPHPAARKDSAMAWSYARRRLILYGGAGQGGEELHDTWEWDGFGWVEVETEVIPPKRSGHAMAATRNGVAILPAANLDDEWELVYGDARPVEDTCRDERDWDNDQRVGCRDPDCFAICYPLCMPGPGAFEPDGRPKASCEVLGPRCGDGNADPLETCRTCPEDVPACAAVCGDYLCDPGETTATCPGDCP